MAIFLDDSGWGCLLGGVLIGTYNTNTEKFKSRMIPIKYFQGATFRTGKYRLIASKLFKEMCPGLGNNNRVNVCRGTILDSIYADLLDQGVYVERVEIMDPLQSWLENKFAISLVKLGVPRVTSGAHCLSFDDQVIWGKQHSEYVKTGWNSWRDKYSR